MLKTLNKSFDWWLENESDLVHDILFTEMFRVDEGEKQKKGGGVELCQSLKTFLAFLR